MLEIQVKKSYIIFTITPLNFAGRSVPPLSLPVFPNSQVFSDLGLSAIAFNFVIPNEGTVPVFHLPPGRLILLD